MGAGGLTKTALDAQRINDGPLISGKCDGFSGANPQAFVAAVTVVRVKRDEFHMLPPRGMEERL